jgi:hypothetical protein
MCCNDRLKPQPEAEVRIQQILNTASGQKLPFENWKTVSGPINHWGPKMLGICPGLANTKIDYAWTGRIGVTYKRVPLLALIRSSSRRAQV